MKKQLSILTKRQKDLLFLVYDYIKSTGYPPTFEDMRVGLDVRSNQSVVDLLAKLVQQNIIKKGEGARSLAILPLGYKALNKPPLTPFMGVTSAGVPMEAVAISGEWRQISGIFDDKLEKLDEQLFMLRVSGDSMINAGIDNGDAVLVQSKKEFVSGEVVLAEIGGDSTIKRFISEDKPPYVYLKPENPKYQNILFTDEVRIKGKVVSVLKDNNWISIK